MCGPGGTAWTLASLYSVTGTLVLLMGRSSRWSPGPLPLPRPCLYSVGGEGGGHGGARGYFVGSQEEGDRDKGPCHRRGLKQRMGGESFHCGGSGGDPWLAAMVMRNSCLLMGKGALLGYS